LYKERLYSREKCGLILCLLPLLCLSISLYGGSKSSKTRFNEKFRTIAVEMKESYDKGDLERVIGLYRANCCIAASEKEKTETAEESMEFQKVKKEIRADIYQWVTLSYMALDMPGMADVYLKKLLVLRHDEGTDRYWLSIRETAKNKYDVAPRLLLGIKSGINLTIAQPGARYSILEHVSQAGMTPYEKDYSFNFTQNCGSQYGFCAEYALSKHLWLSTSLVCDVLLFQYKNRIEWSAGAYPITNDYTHRQRLIEIEIPLFLKYQAANKNLKPFFQLGGFIHILANAFKGIVRRTRERINNQPGGVISYEYVYKDLQIRDQIFNFNAGLSIGAGVGYDIGGSGLRLAVEANYRYMFNNIIDGKRRWTNQNLLLGYYDVFDDIRISNFDLSFKILVPISYRAFKK
ncbi:MAG: PorT family protein, partial [Candidatus Aminicenantes bacterium]|nr:PorT family protein [Candidatus Aminicenantes bacterium]